MTLEELNSLNDDISYINDKLRKRASTVQNLRIIDHPQFVSKRGFINDYLLATDGLHLSFDGTEIVVRNFESAMLEVRYSKMQENLQCFVNTEIVVPNYEPALSEVNDSVMGDKLQYSDVVRFGEKQYQPVLKSTPKVQKEASSTSSARPNRQGKTKKTEQVNREKQYEYHVQHRSPKQTPKSKSNSRSCHVPVKPNP